MQVKILKEAGYEEALTEDAVRNHRSGLGYTETHGRENCK